MSTPFHIVLYRILGSDLPPRHGEGQTLDNLNFILKYERLSPIIERRWILNRIWDVEVEHSLIRLLETNKEIYHRIPFEQEYYSRQVLDATGLPRRLDAVALVSSFPRNKLELLALEWIYRRKNIAAIGLNTARNFAIELGSKEAQWILPFDGNTFMSREASVDFQNVVNQNPDAKYVIVPMVRLANNSDLLENKVNPDNTDEPQIAFRRDSHDRFDEQLRYGRRNKSELLQRLGVPGQWHPAAPWEDVAAKRAQDYGCFAVGSWVARLSSRAHPSVEASNMNRWGMRLLSVAQYCNSLDVSLADVEQLTSNLHCYGDLIRNARKPERLIRKANEGMKQFCADSAGNCRFYLFAERLTTSALAFVFTSNSGYLEDGARSAVAWFNDQRRRAHAYDFASDELSQIWAVLDAVRIIKSAQVLSSTKLGQIADWLERVGGHWSSLQVLEYDSSGSVANDLVIASISAYLGDRAKCVWILNRAPLRLRHLIESSGVQPTRSAQPISLNDSVRTLQFWFNLAQLGRSTGIVDLWHCGATDRNSLAQALRLLFLNRVGFKDYVSNANHFDQRIGLLRRIVPEDAVHSEALEDIPCRTLSTDLIDSRDGVPPNWPLLIDEVERAKISLRQQDG